MRLKINWGLCNPVQIRNICVKDYHGYVSCVVVTIMPFLLSWCIDGYLTMVARRVPQVIQELLTIPELLRFPRLLLMLNVRVAQYLIFCILFFRTLFVPFNLFFKPLLYLSFDLQYLHTFLTGRKGSTLCL